MYLDPSSEYPVPSTNVSQTYGVAYYVCRGIEILCLGTIYYVMRTSYYVVATTYVSRYFETLELWERYNKSWEREMEVVAMR